MVDVSEDDKGVSGALKLIRSRGLTSARNVPLMLAGRSRDARGAEYSVADLFLSLHIANELFRIQHLICVWIGLMNSGDQ
jgi:hypothetical protein